MTKTQWRHDAAVVKPHKSGGNGRWPEAAAQQPLFAPAPAIPPEQQAAHVARLNIIKNPGHFTYKVPGLLAWLALGIAILGAVLAPRVLVIAAQVAGVYMILRLLAVIVFYPIGIRKSRQAERRARALRGRAKGAVAGLHHVVLLPNLEEPVEVLARTLRSLAGQADARSRVTIVLAMEGAETGAHAKAEQLRARFEGYFARVLISIHPADLPGESRGKSSNQAWAARVAYQELVERAGIPLENLTLTSCDADSVLHVDYLAEIGRQFVADPDRYTNVWHAPMRHINNHWNVPSPVRLLSFFFNLVQVSELTDPLSVKLPVSSFTLSFKLADSVGYWDAFALADDWNMFLRCAFGTQGRIRLRPVFLPTSGDAVTGANLWQALANFYRQRLRHAWGCQDVGYVLQQWGRWPDMPVGRKSLYLFKVVHDHVVFTTAGLIIGVGSTVLFLENGLLGVVQPIPGLYSILFQAGNVINAVAISAEVLYEHLSTRRTSGGWRPRRLLTDILLWPLVPVLTMLLVALPTIQAQTRMMFGAHLHFEVTPKQVD